MSALLILTLRPHQSLSCLVYVVGEGVRSTTSIVPVRETPAWTTCCPVWLSTYGTGSGFISRCQGLGISLAWPCILATWVTEILLRAFCRLLGAFTFAFVTRISLLSVCFVQEDKRLGNLQSHHIIRLRGLQISLADVPISTRLSKTRNQT
ncbi:hypothetical protein GGI42DRAFT_117987 [Trichoderma sp. SZMC 28013]